MRDSACPYFQMTCCLNVAISVMIKESLHDYLSQVQQTAHSEVKKGFLLSKRHVWE